VHCLAPKQVLEPVDGVDASDVDVTRRFHDGGLWTGAASPTADTPATVAGVAAAALSTTAQSPVLMFPTSAAGTLIIDDDEDDEVEVMGELYLNMHGPIIDDDDEDE
jgi:hypothetical protein